jgi:hypothetical protein
MKQPTITLSEPFPLLDPGLYVARCTEASYAWARQWKKWIARLVLEPQNYQGRPYSGRLCKLFGLGRDPQKPYAGPQSHFRRLLVEVNGEQPASPHVGVEIFVGVAFDIEVTTVKEDRDKNLRSSEHWYSIVRGMHPSKNAFPDARTPQPFNPEPFNLSTQRTQITHSTDQHSNTVNTPLTEREVRRAALASSETGVSR